jgi:hypothetical protein
MSEIWKDIPEFEGRYQVSDLARVRSFLKQGCNSGLKVDSHLLKPRLNSGKYLYVTLFHSDGSVKHKLLHVLVMLAFKGPAPIGQEICHENGKRSECVLSNLRYDTHKGNKADQNKHGTHTKGERNGNSKLTALDVAKIKELRKLGCTLKSIGDAFGVTPTTIQYIVKEKSWRAA